MATRGGAPKPASAGRNGTGRAVAARAQTVAASGTPPRGSRSARPTSCTSAARSRAPNRAARTSSRAPTARRSPTPAGRRARTSATRSAPRARRSMAGPAKTAMNRGQVLYRVAELMEGRRDQFVAEVAAAEGLRPAAARAAVDRADRPLGLVRRLGRQDRPGPRLVQPGRRAVLQLHDPRADRRRRRRRPGDLVAARAGQPARAAARDRQRGRAHRQRASAAAGRDADRGARHVRRAGRRRQRPDRAQARSSSRSSPRTATSTRSTPGACPTSCGPRSSCSPPTTSSASCAGRRSVAEARFDWLDDARRRSVPNGSPPSSR